MANTQSMCTSFLGELLTGTHNFGAAPIRAASTADTFKAALYYTTATINAATTAYTATGEITGGAGYTATGIVVTNATVPAYTNASATAGTAYWTPSGSLQWTGFTQTTAFDTVLIYNSTQGGKAVSVHTFGSQTITSGTFTLTMPTNNTTTALLRLATV